MKGFQLLCELEGIIPALESSHAIGYLMELAPILSEVFCSMNWTMHLREEIMNDVVLKRAHHLGDVAFITSVEVSENDLNMGIWFHN